MSEPILIASMTGDSVELVSSRAPFTSYRATSPLELVSRTDNAGLICRRFLLLEIRSDGAESSVFKTVVEDLFPWVTDRGSAEYRGICEVIGRMITSPGKYSKRSDQKSWSSVVNEMNGSSNIQALECLVLVIFL